MPEILQLAPAPDTACAPAPSSSVLWLQGITIAWMLMEVGVSAYAACTAHSAVIFAFGADSLVEVFSAAVVLFQFTPRFALSQKSAARVAGVLLFVLAAVVATLAAGSLVLRIRPQASCSGIAITIAALIAMPVLAGLKRREARRSNNRALAADAVQSATCAYLALIALAGLACNAAFHIPRIDSFAALMAIPFLIREGVLAWKGHTCGCC